MSHSSRLSFFFFLLLLSVALRAQSATFGALALADTASDSALMPLPYAPAAFPGGNDALLRELMPLVVYPDLARDHAVEGTVVVRLKIDADGEVSATKLIKGIGYGCDEAALTALEKMPAWLPARAYGTATESFVYVPLRFRLR